MKSTKILSILFILLISMVYMACDQEHMERKGVTMRPATDEEFIRLRGCPITCPLADCCCGVWLQGTDPASLALCGTSNGSGDCDGDAVGNCSSFSGGGFGPFNLTHPNAARQDFCMDVNAPFWIANTHDQNDAVIYLRVKAI